MSDWISVEDELPEQYQDVFLYMKESIYKFAHGYWCYVNGEIVWQQNTDFCTAKNGIFLKDSLDVTHWMRNPPEPIEVQNEI